MKNNKEIQLTYNEVKEMSSNDMISFVGSNEGNIVPSKNFIKQGNKLMMQQNSAPRPVFHTIGYFK